MSHRTLLPTLISTCLIVFTASCGLADDSSAAVPPNDAGTTCEKPVGDRIAPPNPKLIKLPFAFPEGMENTPVIFQGQRLLVQNRRSGKPGSIQDQADLFIQDLANGKEVAKFATGFSFVSALVNGDELNVFAAVNTSNQWTKDIYRFWSKDLKNWKHELAIARDHKDQHLFNTSVCRDDQGYLMAYEVSTTGSSFWSFRFARSKDLAKWEKVPDLAFADLAESSFCACPVIRYMAPYYYVIYGIQWSKGIGKRYQYQLPTTKWISALARSKDLVTWELSPCRGPILDPTAGEGNNNTDADLFECEGRTYIFYATGDQSTWGTIRVAMYDGPMKEMFEAHFPEGVPMVSFDARQKKYIYPEETP